MNDDSKSALGTPRIPWWLGACLFAAIAVFLLWEEHSAHILGAVPYLLLLGCPIIHLFMHGRHGNGKSTDHGHHHGGGAA